MNAIKKVEWAIHLGIVLVTLTLLNYPKFDLTFGLFNSGDGSFLWPSAIGTFFNLVLFYTIAFYLIPVSLKQGTGLFIVRLVLLLIIVSAIESWIDSIFYRALGFPMDGAIWSELILMVFVTHFFVVILAFAYRFLKDWFANERLRRSINEHQLQSELEVLKSQINPHFLFNALNSLFSMALQSGDAKTAEGINKLSEMMRYVLDKTGSNKVSLKEEVGYIKDFIFLQQLRFEKQVNVHFVHPDMMPDFYIAPMLLIPFVENAFKYGVSSQTKTEIEIQVSCNDDSFAFEVENQKTQMKETIASSGVGLKNVKKRLNLMYPERHELVIHEDRFSFKIRLVIFIKDEVYSN